MVKNLLSNADVGSIPGSGRSPGGGHGNPLQYSCLENPMDRGAWQATVHGVAKSQTRLSDEHFHFLSFVPKVPASGIFINQSLFSLLTFIIFKDTIISD